MYKRCVQTRLPGRADVAAVTDVEDLADEGHGVGHPFEGLGVGLAGAPVVGRTDQVDVVGDQRPQDPPARTV